MDEKTAKRKSWLYHWLIDNRFINFLLGLLLILIVIYMLHKVQFIFEPIIKLFSAVGAPIIVGGIFYYLLNPLVDRAQKRWHWQRWIMITILFVLLTSLLVGSLAILIPILTKQLTELINSWPTYWKNINDLVEKILNDPNIKPMQSWFDKQNQALANNLRNFSTTYLSGAVGSVSGAFSHISSFFITLITFPFVLFYLLKDGEKLPHYLAQFVPNSKKQAFIFVLREINGQVANYVRGQLIVAFAVAIMFSVGYMIIGMPYGIGIGVAAGFLNLIPFLGSFLAMVPAIVVAIFISPIMLVKVMIVFMIEQTLEGKVISPKVLGDSLKIHPLTVIVVLLSSGNIFGLMGVIFGIPGYAVLKVLTIHLYDYWKSNSLLFSKAERQAVRMQHRAKIEQQPSEFAKNNGVTNSTANHEDLED